MSLKRSRAAMEGPKTSAPAAERVSPLLPMFEHFRAELDEHHDRRERMIKASRDVTAASKKIIFTLQRVRALAQPLPQHVHKANTPYQTTISAQLASVAGDLQGLNAHRYARQVSGGCQEWMEAVSFQVYLETGRLVSWEEARAMLRAMGRAGGGGKGEGGGGAVGVELSAEDYVLGIYDMTGELMRFAITAMAMSGALPAVSPPPQQHADADTAMDVDVDAAAPAQPRTLLTDMRALRAALESLDPRGSGPFAKEAEKKAEVMRTSVEKVEKALYGLIVRGAERPKGWMPVEERGGGMAVGVEG
ncbi:hypothetical protein LTR08_005612 [Meristemomyces frigidus]|nr:hypothetical protein LTR08_005612 [Meristemomyces frigidus]